MPSRSLRLLFAAALVCSLWGCKSKEMKPAPYPEVKPLTYYKAHARQREYWPTASWKTKTPAEMGIHPERLKEAVDYAFKQSGNDKDRKGIRTEGLVIIKNGYLVFEKYARGYTKDKPHLFWSVSKSYVNALYGIAVKQKLCSMDDVASKYYKHLRSSAAHKKITLKHLMHMTPGLYWKEGYEASPLNSTVIAMLYSEGRKDMAKFTAGFHVRYPPGRHFYYSSGTTNLAVGVLRSILEGKSKKMEAFMWGELFDKLGMRSVTWQRDGVGNVVGSSFLYSTPRDAAKFGYLYLNDGIWEGKRLFAPGWVRFTATSHSADRKGRYGAHWWLNAGRKGFPPSYPSAPRDLFRAGGHWGQRIDVFPSHDMVVVMTADNRDKTFKIDHFYKLLMEGVSKKQFFAKSPAKDRAPSQKSSKAPAPKKRASPAKAPVAPASATGAVQPKRNAPQQR